MNKELQQNESGSFNSYEDLIKELKSSCFEYYDSREVDAFSFFITNYNDFGQECHNLYNVKSKPILLCLEKHGLLKKTENNMFNFFDKEFFPFDITESGSNFYEYVQKNIEKSPNLSIL